MSDNHRDTRNQDTLPEDLAAIRRTWKPALRSACNRDTLLEDFAAELTLAVFAIVLQHGTRGSWLELELGLWRVVSETVTKWDAIPVSR
jgi:hypothetical protein